MDGTWGTVRSDLVAKEAGNSHWNKVSSVGIVVLLSESEIPRRQVLAKRHGPEDRVIETRKQRNKTKLKQKQKQTRTT